MATKARLLTSTADQWRVYLASREAQRRRGVSTLDKVYSRLMLGRRAERTVDKNGKVR